MPETLTADINLYPSGELVGQLTGFVCKKAIAALLAAIDHITIGFMSRCMPSALEGGLRSSSFLTAPSKLVASLPDTQVLLAAEGLTASAMDGLVLGLQQLSQGFAYQALTDLGWRSAPAADLETLRTELKVVSEHRRLFVRLLELVSVAR